MKNRLGITIYSLDPWYFDDAICQDTLKEHFKVGSLTGLGLADYDCGIIASGALLIYLKETQKTALSQMTSIHPYTAEKYMLIDSSSRRNLELVETLREKGLLKVDDGASIVDLDKYKMPPCLILKNDGSSIYPSRDIAAAVYRMETYHFDKCIYVTSAGQSLHFAQWFKVVELMGYDWYDRLVHVPYGTVSIDGAKLATRTGNVVLLKDLFATAIEKARAIIEEKNPTLENKDEVAKQVGVGAIVFHYLSNSRIKDINFVMEDALSFVS